MGYKQKPVPDRYLNSDEIVQLCGDVRRIVAVSCDDPQKKKTEPWKRRGSILRVIDAFQKHAQAQPDAQHGVECDKRGVAYFNRVVREFLEKPISIHADGKRGYALREDTDSRSLTESDVAAVRVAHANSDGPTDNVLHDDKKPPSVRRERSGPLEIPAQYFPTYHDAYLDFKNRVLLEFDAGNRIVIQWLGLDMRYGAPDLTDLLASTPVAVQIEIRMLDPDWSEIKKLHPSWRTTTAGNCQTLADFLTKHHRATPPIAGELYTYRDLPHIHGFSLNHRYYYLSWANWEEHVMRVTGYDLYESEKDLRSKSRVELFTSWLKYFRQRQQFPRPPAPTRNRGRHE